VADAHGDKEADRDEESESPKGSLFITSEGAFVMRAEWTQLLKVERPKVTAEVSFAASLGDRSENAEYIYGKKRLREIDRRLRFLQRRLESLTVVDARAVKDQSRIYFAATVGLRNETDGRLVTYQLVGPDETDLKVGKISIDSLVGRALIGKRVGELVTVRRPIGDVEFTIFEIKYV
jgi:transcription elongation factor GreB